MPKAITNTSPLLYLYRIGVIEWLPEIFDEILTAPAVVKELAEGQRQGYDVPCLSDYEWLQVIQPHSVPSEWLALDLGQGELETMALALEHSSWTVILDDALARRIAQAASLEVWGTLRILLEAKKQSLIPSIAPLVERLQSAGMWISNDVGQRVLALAGE
ncbi:MAG: DUF3368 domain-containing protein [Chloroflexota bacterium]|nr:MAG: DUF3368 domain-containing protein [Chloroflexota bacterium]